MAKITLDSVASGYDLSIVNANFQAIEDELNNKVLYRNPPIGEVNTLEKDLDANGKNLYNVNEINGNDVSSLTANLETVANNIADINTVAPYVLDIEIVADNITDVNNFSDVYQGAKASDPVLRNNGDALVAGDLYFNTVEDALRAYSGTVWKEGTAGTISVQTFSGDSVTTSFNLTAAPASENNTQVYISGVYKQKNQYSISGTTLTFYSAPPTGTDNIEVVTIATLALGETDAGMVSYLPAGGGAVETTVQNKLRTDLPSVIDVGADNTGATDSSSAINAAIAAMPNPSTLRFPKGTYLLNSEVLLPYSGVNGSGKHIHFEGCQFIAGANNINLLHWCESHVVMTGMVKLSANGKTGVTALRMTPEDEAQLTTVVNQNHNRFLGHINFDGCDESIVMMAGPYVGGTASGCWYNVFKSTSFSSVKRAIWLKDSGDTTAGRSGSNSNTFYSPVMNGSINTGIQIDAGGGNTFYSPQFENITTGTSPNAVPTALLIANAMANGGDNPDNTLIDAHWENCTRHADIDEPYTHLINHDMDAALNAGSATILTSVPKNTAMSQYFLAGLRSTVSRGVERVRLTDDGLAVEGLLDLSNPHGVNAAGQIKFPASQNASANVNTLDDYEEGEAVVTMSADGGTITIDPAYDTLAYTKIGRQITVTGLVVVQSVSGPTGAFKIDGLPFAPNGGGTQFRTSCSIWANGLAGGATTTLMGRVLEGTTSIEIRDWAAGNLTAGLAPDIQAGTEFTISLTYFAS